MTRTRILHISANQYPPLPAQHNTLAIWRELARDVDEYHVVARSKDYKFSTSRLGNIHLHLVPRILDRQAEFVVTSWFLPYYVWKYRPTHFLAQCPVLGGWAAVACALLTRRPLMLELHGEHYFPNRGRRRFAGFVFRQAARVSLALADRVRALSDDMKEHVRRTYGARVANKTVVIPTRVDLRLFGPPKDDYSVGERLRLVTAGAFAPLKNHLALVQALAQSDVPVSLSIVGDGKLRLQYERAIRDLGMRGRVELPGWVAQDRLAALLGAHDVYVHYSLTEALPRAVLEAMAMGVPVVATDVGFTRGILVDHDNALLLREPFAASLHKALRSLYASESLRRRLGTSAHRTICERFEWRRVFDDYRHQLHGPLLKIENSGS